MRPVDDPRFAQFFADEYERTVRALALYTGDHDVAVDAVAEAIARAWERMRKGEEIESLEAWTRTVAFNEARRTFRRRSSEREARNRLGALPVAADDPGADDADVVKLLLRQLSKSQREVVILRYYLQLDPEEIASELGIRVSTVHAVLRRARARLTGLMNNHADQSRARGADHGSR